MPNRRQAIIWTNADPIYWRMNAALGRDELNVDTFHHPVWIHSTQFAFWTQSFTQIHNDQLRTRWVVNHYVNEYLTFVNYALKVNLHQNAHVSVVSLGWVGSNVVCVCVCVCGVCVCGVGGRGVGGGVILCCNYNSLKRSSWHWTLCRITLGCRLTQAHQ